MSGRRSWPEPSAGSTARSSPSTRPATTPSSSARVERAALGVAGPALVRVDGRLRMIDAVVFDLDGVIVDSEQVWDAVRERPRTRARRPLDRVRAARHDGHELARVVALPARGARARGVAGGAERRGRPSDARALPRRAPADRRRSRSGRAPRRRLPPRCRIVVESTVDRRRPGTPQGSRPFSRRPSPRRRSPAASRRQTSTWRPHGGSESIRPAAPPSKTRRTASALRTLPGCASSRSRTGTTRRRRTLSHSPTSCSALSTSSPSTPSNRRADSVSRGIRATATVEAADEGAEVAAPLKRGRGGRSRCGRRAPSRSRGRPRARLRLRPDRAPRSARSRDRTPDRGSGS